MADSNRINLWECLTGRVYSKNIGEYSRQQGQKFLKRLALTSRFPGQEIALKVLEDGWQITIFSSYTTDYDERGDIIHTPVDEILIHIPSDLGKPPTIREVIHESP